MSKRIKILIISLIAVIFFALGVLLSYFYIKYIVNNKDIEEYDNMTTYTDDNIKFKSEYESLNNKLDETGELEYPNVSISQDNLVEYISLDKIKSIFENKESAIIYFGFESCPWCRNIVPVLIETCKSNNISNIYYMNIKDMRDKKVLDENGKIITQFEGTDEYKNLLELFKADIDVYDGLNDDTIKRIYAPTVYFIKNGEIVKKHVGSVSSQENPKIALTDEQKNELEKIYKDGITKISLNDQDKFICDEDKNC